MASCEAVVNALTRHFDSIFDWAGTRVRQLVVEAHPDVDNTRVIDVGAGQGKYRILLVNYPLVDAVEVFEAYVRDNQLRDLYRWVHVLDVCDFISKYDEEYFSDTVIIMGDVLEHLTRDDAQRVLAHFRKYANDIIVVVPYEYPQDEEDGNVHQRHLQEDLTPELMGQLYPELTLVEIEVRDDKPFKGIYRWRR